MYHRVADEPIDPWNICVSPAHFEEHLRVIRRTRHALPLTEFVERHVMGILSPEAVALTFDDGYVDNLSAGKPRLTAADVPATIFLATGYLDRPSEFWWDELARFILLEPGPRTVNLVVSGERKRFEFTAASQECRRGGRDGAPSASRRAMLIALWEAIRRLGDEERETTMAELRSIFSVHGSRVDRGRAMTREEVQRLVADGLITIGAHTVTHPVLPELRNDARNREIIESKRACEILIEAPVAGFSYPYGELDAQSRAAVKAAGFGFACAAWANSARRGPTTAATSDVFALPRVQVRDCDGDAFERTLRLTATGL